jgi:hypothetical protein
MRQIELRGARTHARDVLLAGFLIFSPLAQEVAMPGGPRALSAGFDAQAAIGAALGNAVGTDSFIAGACVSR